MRSVSMVREPKCGKEMQGDASGVMVVLIVTEHICLRGPCVFHFSQLSRLAPSRRRAACEASFVSVLMP